MWFAPRESKMINWGFLVQINQDQNPGPIHPVTSTCLKLAGTQPKEHQYLITLKWSTPLVSGWSDQLQDQDSDGTNDARSDGASDPRRAVEASHADMLLDTDA